MPEEIEDEVVEDEEMEEELPEADAQAMVMEAVTATFAEDGEAAGLEGDEAIDAVIAKLESMKTGATESVLGGLGDDGEAMDLGEPDGPVE